MAQGRGPYRDGGRRSKPTVWTTIANLRVRVENAGVFRMYDTASVGFETVEPEGVRAVIFEFKPLLGRLLEKYVGQVVRVTVQVETEAEIEE